MNDIDPNEAVNHIFKTGKLYAKAKSERIQLQEFRKSKKAILFMKCREGTDKAKESYAYAHEEYLQLLVSLEDAVEREERYRYELKAAELRVEIWRTQQANNRIEYNAGRMTT